MSVPRRTAIDRFFEFSLLGLLLSGYLAVAGSGYLDAPTAVLGAAGLLLRGLLVAGVVRIPLTDRFVTALTIAYICFYPLDYFFFSGEFLAATVHLVFFVAVAKLLTARTNRDYFFLKVIAFLELLAASVLSSSLTFFVFLALFMAFAVATFASSEIRRAAGKPGAVARGGLRLFHWRLASLTLITTLGILAMSGAMFFILPRTARAAFQHLVSERYRLPGFSNEVVLGQLGEVKQQSTPVMHVRVFSVEGPMLMKWRGAALSQFDGVRWSTPLARDQLVRVQNRIVQLADDRQRWRSGMRINYEVSLKGIASDALFLAGSPEFLMIGVPSILRSPAGTYRLGYGTTDGLRYGAYSFIEEPRAAPPYPAPAPLSPGERREYLSLPPLDPRIAPLAAQWAAGLKGDEARARAVESALHRRYGYTLELLPATVDDPLAHFLFDRRKGHCEYFASAMAVMLRSLGIPSRVVTGFQSGIYNPLTGWHVIRASDAHSWVEAWIPGRGWRTYDPTPPDPNQAQPSLFSRINLYLDAAETFWQEWVLNYNLDRQMVLAYRMEQSSRSLRFQWVEDLARSTRANADAAAGWFRTNARAIVAGLVALVLLAFAVPRIWPFWQAYRRTARVKRGQVAAGDAALLYLQMLKLLKRRGFEKPAWLTPIEFARVLPPSPAAAIVADFTATYNALRFGREVEAAPRLVLLLERLEKGDGRT